MLLSVFSIFDSAVKSWLPPIYARNKGEMLRQFQAAVNDSQSNFFKYPSDYTLFELGSFNDDNCKFDLFITPISLGMAQEFVKPAFDSNTSIDRRLPESVVKQ